MIFDLHEWGVCDSSDPYTPPECTVRWLTGWFINRAGKRRYVTTSPMDKIDGNRITTSSGNVYVLHEPNPEYVAWCASHGIAPPDPQNPIRVKA